MTAACGPAALTRTTVGGEEEFHTTRAEAAEAMVAELADDLRAHGEEAEVAVLLDRLWERGTSASRQRRTWERTGDPGAVAAGVVREGLPG